MLRFAGHLGEDYLRTAAHCAAACLPTAHTDCSVMLTLPHASQLLVWAVPVRALAHRAFAPTLAAYAAPVASAF
eukprot:scaffold68252_cov103-Phaeocystis_antarctica.AAC.2